MYIYIYIYIRAVGSDSGALDPHNYLLAYYSVVTMIIIIITTINYITITITIIITIIYMWCCVV